MKNKALFWAYMERIIIAVPGLLLLHVILMNRYAAYNDEAVISSLLNYNGLFFGLEMFVMILAMWNFMGKVRSKEEQTFVNALPITRKEQFQLISLCVCIMVTLLTLGDLLVHFMWLGTWKEWKGLVFGAVVREAVMLFGILFAVWIFVRVIPAAGKFLKGLVVLGCMLYFGMSYLNSLQKVFAIKGDTFWGKCVNGWNILTLPRGIYGKIQEMSSENILYFPNYSQSYKLKLFVGIMLVIVIGGMLLYHSDREYFCQSPLEAELTRWKSPAAKGLKIAITCGLAALIFGTIMGYAIQTEQNYQVSTCSDDEFQMAEKTQMTGRNKILGTKIQGTIYSNDILGVSYHYYAINGNGRARVWVLLGAFAGAAMEGLRCFLIGLWRKKRGGRKRK